MRWFYVQRLAASPSGGTSATYIGPFYGIPATMQSLIGHGYYVLIYIGGTWTPLSVPPGP